LKNGAAMEFAEKEDGARRNKHRPERYKARARRHKKRGKRQSTTKTGREGGNVIRRAGTEGAGQGSVETKRNRQLKREKHSPTDEICRSGFPNEKKREGKTRAKRKKRKSNGEGVPRLRQKKGLNFIGRLRKAYGRMEMLEQGARTPVEGREGGSVEKGSNRYRRFEERRWRILDDFEEKGEKTFAPLLL